MGDISQDMADPVQGEAWRKEALKLNTLLRGQKAAVTREIAKCKSLVMGYKSEKQAGSSLVRSTAATVNASWDLLNEKLTTLE